MVGRHSVVQREAELIIQRGAGQAQWNPRGRVAQRALVQTTLRNSGI